MGNIRKKSENLIALLVVFALGSIMMTGCQKDKDPEPDYSKVYLLKEMIDEGDTHIMGFISYYHTYEYDSLGRIIKYYWKFPAGVDTTTYVYNDSTSITVTRSGNYLNYTDVLELNENGLVVSENKLNINLITRYVYNSDGYRILSKSYSYGVDTSDITSQINIKTYTYSNGNLIRVESESGYKEEYSYYSNKVNTLGYRNKGMAFYGKSSKNLAIDKDATDQFDAENRLIKRSLTDWSYEYEYY